MRGKCEVCGTKTGKTCKTLDRTAFWCGCGAVASQGGKRKGAGRKPAPKGSAKVPYGTKLEPLVVEYLRQCENAAVEIETSVKKSKAFKQWKATRSG